MYKFYKGKKILVTGHTGFKGTWLSLMLETLGACVYGFAKNGEEQKFSSLANPKMAGEVLGDIRDQRSIIETLDEFQPEMIIHLASHSTLNEGDELTRYIFETNMMGVINLFEAVRGCKSVQAVLIVTSDKCYENKESAVGYSENDALGAQDPYSTSKAVQELITECYRKSFFQQGVNGVRIATARASNVIGGGDYNLTRLVPNVLECLVKGRPVEIRKPDAVRPWQNVLDVLYGYLLLMRALCETDALDNNICSAFNFGPNEDGFVAVRKVAEILAQQFSNAKIIVNEAKLGVKETTILKLKSDKAKKILGWNPQFGFEDTMKMAANFAIFENQGRDVKTICLDMINDFWRKKNVY